MKTITFKPRLILALAVMAVLVLPGCYIHDDCDYCGAPPPPPPPPPCVYGTNGVPGPAFFGVDWNGDQPDYLWCNNTALPNIFYYGTYYNTLPGTFHLYYEGSFYQGCCPVTYHWDVDFVVWVNAGTYGGCGYSGVNGLPSYLMLSLGVNGPAELRTNKTAGDGTRMEILKETADEIEVLYTRDEINVLVTYKRLDESIKHTLDPKFEVTAAKK